MTYLHLLLLAFFLLYCTLGLGMKQSNKIVSLCEYRDLKNQMLTKDKLFYMEKAELLDELIQYYEAIKKDPCNIELALFGEDLMDVISQRALTRELYELAEDYQEKGPHKVFNLEKPSK